MFEVMFLGILGMLWLLFASIHDIRKRMVYNWTCFSLIIFALGFRFFFALFTERSFWFFYQGLIWVFLFWIISNIFYYSRMFAGGDSTLMIAMGSILPFYDSFLSNLRLVITFIFLFLAVGAIYGFLWSIFLAIKHRKRFLKSFKRLLKENKNRTYFLMVGGILLMVFSFFSGGLMFSVGVLFFLFSVLWLFAKAVDDSCMIKSISPSMLIEGDWLFQDVKIGEKTIAANWDGVEIKDIEALKKKGRNVLIREGIPFVPVFLISYLLYLAIFIWDLWNPVW